MLEPSVESATAGGLTVSLVRGPGTLRLAPGAATALVTFVPQVARLAVAGAGGTAIARPARMRSLGLCFAPPGATREVTLLPGAELLQVAALPRALAALLRRAGHGRQARLAAFEDRRDAAVARLGPELRRALMSGEAIPATADAALLHGCGREYLRCLGEALLLRCLPPALQAGMPEPDRLSARALARVHRLLDESVEQRRAGVRQLAEAAGLSTAHFSRAYKATTGESPHQALLRRRIERGCELLRETTLGIAAVAARTGFASQAHFTSTFRRIVGMTPGVFRRRHARGAPAPGAAAGRSGRR